MQKLIRKKIVTKTDEEYYILHRLKIISDDNALYDALDTIMAESETPFVPKYGRFKHTFLEDEETIELLEILDDD